MTINICKYIDLTCNSPPEQLVVWWRPAKSQVHSSMLVASLRVMFTQLSVDESRHLCKYIYCSQSTELYKNLQKGLQKNKILNKTMQRRLRTLL